VEWTCDDYVISTDRARPDRQAVWGFLREGSWSPGVSFEVVDRAILATDDGHELYARFGFRPVDADRRGSDSARPRQSD
jgi:hypothetical protein